MEKIQDISQADESNSPDFSPTIPSPTFVPTSRNKLLWILNALVCACFIYLFLNGQSQGFLPQSTYNQAINQNIHSSSPSSQPTTTTTTSATSIDKETNLTSIEKGTTSTQPIEANPTSTDDKTPVISTEEETSPTSTDQKTDTISPSSIDTTTPTTPTTPEPKEETVVPKTESNLNIEPSFDKLKASQQDGPGAFRENGGVIGIRDMRRPFLCRLKINSTCDSKYIADSVDLMYAYCPIYSSHREQHPLLYARHTNFVNYMKSFGLSVVQLEAVYPGQDFVKTRPGHEPWEIQLEIQETFYYRENLLNVAIRKTTGYEYIIWIDAHHFFLNTYWWEETITKTEHFNSVQLFQTLAHVSLEQNVTISEWFDLSGPLYAYSTTMLISHYVLAWRGMWLGNAMAIRREIYEGIGYIIDDCIAGCCDCAFDYASFLHYWDRLDIYPNYGEQLMPWVLNSRKVIKGKSTVVRGKMYHLWHEHFFDWGHALDSFKFNPGMDIKKELYRDDNYTLHIKEGSKLLEIFPRA